MKGELYHWKQGLVVVEGLHHEDWDDWRVDRWYERCFRERPVIRVKERLEKVSEPSSETKVGLRQLCRMVRTYSVRSNERLASHDMTKSGVGVQVLRHVGPVAITKSHDVCRLMRR